MANYKGFDINTTETPKPWGSRQEQWMKDCINNILGDSIDSVSRTLGHRHNKLYESDAGATVITIDADGKVNLNKASGDPTLALQIGGVEKASMYVDDDDSDKLTLVSTDDLKIDCGTNKTLELQDSVWDDIQFSLSTAKVPAVNAPTWAAFTANTNKYTFAVNDYVDLEAQELFHKYKEGTDVKFHIHLYTNGSDGTDRTVKYTIYYCITANDGVASESSVSAQITIPANTPDLTHMIEAIGTVDGSSFGIGDDITVRVERVVEDSGTAPSNDPFVSMVGLHVEQDTLGSRQETSK